MLTVILTRARYYLMNMTKPRLKRAIAGCQYAEIFAGEVPSYFKEDAFLDRYR
jgi:hypothetical protein